MIRIGELGRILLLLLGEILGIHAFIHYVFGDSVARATALVLTRGNDSVGQYVAYGRLMTLAPQTLRQTPPFDTGSACA